MKNLPKKLLQKPVQPDEFYIGYQPVAPPGYKKFVHLLLFTLVVIMYITASVIVSNQLDFSAGIFERKKLTEVEGVLMLEPFPAIRTYYGKDLNGNPAIKTIPLVNYGKFGAEPIIEAVAKSNSAPLSILWVKLRGKLIYNKGVTLMELSEKDKSILQVIKTDGKPIAELSAGTATEMDSVTLSGQIIDPKCYFGVMKPGEGKPHSDCAIRCIAGGIQPMLMLRNSKGEETYFILRDTAGMPLNNRILSYIGMPVDISGRVRNVDDWMILNTDPLSGIRLTNR